MTIGRFSVGAAALVWCPVDGKYLLLQRSATKDLGGGAWECVTGRVDQGEGFADAVRRVHRKLGSIHHMLEAAHSPRPVERDE